MNVEFYSGIVDASSPQKTWVQIAGISLGS